ncbi:unnamed protein product [Moneuplotes crassus]|uniref:Uncharacterized protein n=1 Tax=Euplotes crassus TaxID=5936 RepID=A0AAD1U5V1_EUPCR|nr:unnamed protein product [Moneuplotes crassus]
MEKINKSDLTSSTPETLNIEQLIEKAGGFGRLQWIMLLYAVIAKQGASFFMYNLAYLELVPRLECYYIESEFVECEVEDICQGGVLKDRDLWRPDYTDSKSFRNWMTDMELYCYSEFMIGLIGSIIFVGFVLSGIVLKVGDRFGRKKTIISGVIINMMACFVLYFWRNLYVIYVVLLLCGVLLYKNISIYILTIELIPTRHRMNTSSLINSAEAFLVYIPTTIFLLAGGKNMQHFLIVGLVLPVISLIPSFLIPESPKYLFEKGMFPELRKTLSYISRFNGAQMGDYIIEGEQDCDSSKFSHEESSVKLDMTMPDNFNATKEKINISKVLEEYNPNEVHQPLLKSIPKEEFSVCRELKHRRTLLNLISIVICFCIASFSYYMVGIFLKYVGANSVSEIAGNFGGGFIQNYIGTKKTLITCFSISLIASVPLLFVNNTILIAVCVFMGKFFLQGAFNVVYFASPEVFPPLFVSFSFMVSGIISRMFTIFAPQVAEVKPRQVPIIILLVLCFIGSFVPILLKASKK